MRKFEIVSPNGQVSAWLLYDEAADKGTIKINKEADPNAMGPLLKICYDLKQWEMEERLTLIYIRERVCPPERENIQSILTRWGLTEYNPFLLSFALGGEAVCDHDVFREVTDECPSNSAVE